MPNKKLGQAIQKEIRRFTPTKAEATAQSLMHKAGLRVFLAGKTTTQMPAAAGPAKASYTGNLKLNRF